MRDLATRTFVVGAVGLAALAVVERVFFLFGYTLIRKAYSPGRLIEFATMLLVAVLALLLWDVREELRRKQA